MLKFEKKLAEQWVAGEKRVLSTDFTGEKDEQRRPF